MSLVRLHLMNPHWGQSHPPGRQATGTAFIENEKRSGAELAQRLPSAEARADEWRRALRGFNGFFAAVAHSSNRLVAAVDRVRSIPLFYGQQDDQFFLSDDAEWVRQQLADDEMDPISKEEFQLAGYVTGQNTLYPNLKQLQAGEWLRVTSARGGLSVTSERYYRFLHTEPVTYDEPRLRLQLDGTVERSVHRLINYAAGRQIVIPLSRGYDSRLIATWLKRLGYDNVLTFTYGVPGNKESQYSKEVAAALGANWHFVEYSAQKWREAWQTEERIRYQRWGSGWSTLPHVQDWLAVKCLREQGKVEPNCVFSPGHGAMAILSHVAGLSQQNNTEALASSIWQKKYNLTPIQHRQERLLKPTVLASAEEIVRAGSPDQVSAFSTWEWQERQAKFLANSVRVYEFFDYDWWLPLWDSEFMAFWQRAPFRLRNSKAWYIDYVREAYHATARVPKRWNLNNASESGLFWQACRRVLPRKVKCFSRRLFVNKSRESTMHASFGRYPTHEYVVLSRCGYRHNGIVAHFFFKDMFDGDPGDGFEAMKDGWRRW